MRTAAIAALALAAATPAAALEVLRVDYQEGQGYDNMNIISSVPCPGFEVLEVRIDLTGTSGLFFDTEPGGAGYPDSEFPGPINPTDGGDYISEIAELTDGGQTLRLVLAEFEGGDQLRFHIDVDRPDAEQAVEMRSDITTRDFAGATASAKMRNAAGEERAEIAVFGQTDTVSIVWNEACPATQDE